MASDNSKNLNAPDVFQVQALSVVDRLAQNPKPVWITGAVIIAVFVGGYAFKYFKDASTEKRQNAIAQVDSVYEAEMKTYTAAREGLEKQREALIAKQPVQAETQSPVETPEVKALNDQIKALKPTHADSSAKYLEFYKANPKAAEGLAAGLKHAAYVANNGDLDAARTELNAIVADSKSEKIIHAQSLMLLISIELDKNDFDAAIKHSDELVASVGKELLPKALLTKSQALFLKKDFPAAKAALDKLITDHGTSPEAERARGLLALIPA
ncbi:MAG: tetratricopeptide repeat protein [Proteobacteria bacterium]|nr:MAG: tetratricopeptide repeat protein [Pseudomonadota bacterium]